MASAADVQAMAQLIAAKPPHSKRSNR